MAATPSSSICRLSSAAFKPTSFRASTSFASANYSTTSRPAQPSARPSPIFKRTPQLATLPSASNALSARHASTSSASTPTTAASSSSTTPQTTLTWDEFLKLRRTRRYVNLGASIFSGIGSIAAATPVFAEYEIEHVGAQLTGLDPMFVIGGSLMGVGAVGWLMGPFLGTAVFKTWKSSVAPEFARKEKDFYTHIKRYRADPASSSVNNPVPDYYGEKIGSVADYRRWLKDQRAFNRKKNKNMI